MTSCLPRGRIAEDTLADGPHASKPRPQILSSGDRALAAARRAPTDHDVACRHALRAALRALQAAHVGRGRPPSGATVTEIVARIDPTDLATAADVDVGRCALDG